MRKLKQSAAVLLFPAISAGMAGAVAASPFNAGDFAVYRVTGLATLSSVATAVFVDEYTPTGTLVQTFDMPTSNSGDTHALTASGSATSEGLLTVSPDGKYLALTGYGAAPGTAGIANTTSTSTARVVGIINTDTGSVDTSTALTDAFSGNNVRSAVTTDGSGIWLGGAASSGSTATAGVRYTTDGSTTSTAVETAQTNVRSVNIFGGQLLYSTGSGTSGIYNVGSGMPTTASPISLLSASTSSPYEYFQTALASNGAVAANGLNTLYVVDSAGVFSKYSYSTSTSSYVFSSNISSGVSNITGITGESDGSGGELLLVSSPSTIYTIDDSGMAFSTPHAIVTAGAFSAFRGIAAVPEPATAGLLLLSAAALLLRRRQSSDQTIAI